MAKGKNDLLIRFAKTKNNLFLVIAVILTVLFFYPVFLKGYIPFPGDLLLAEYQPWRSYSYGGMNPGAVPNKAQYFDSIRQIYPWKTEVISQIKNGSFPLWNPYNFSGAPLFANFQSAVLYPLNVVYFFLPQHAGWSLLVMIQPLFSFLMLFLFARKMGISKIGSIFASIGYAFSLYMTTFLEYNTIGHFLYLLPLSLLLFEYCLDGKKLALPALSFIIASTLFAGHLQLFGGNLMFLILYMAIRFAHTRKSKTLNLKILFFVILGIGIGCIQLIPGIELISNSARNAHSTEFFYDNLLIRPDQIILYLTPDIFGNPAVKNYLLPFSYPSKALYVGIITIVLFVFGLLSKKGPLLTAVSICSLIFALLVFLSPVSFLLYKLNLPIISSSSPSNYIYLVSIGICLIAGSGYDSFVKANLKKVIIILCIFLTFIVGIYTATTFFHIPIIKNGLILSIGIFLASSFAFLLIRIIKLQKIGITLSLLILTLDLFYFFHKFNSFVPSSYIYPSTAINTWIKKNAQLDRYWGFKSGHIEPNFQTQTQTYSLEGYDPLFPKTYHDFVALASKESSRSDALLDHDLTDINLKILSTTSTRYVIDKFENASTQDTFPSKYFQKVLSLNDFSVQENLKSAPRLFLTKSYSIYSNLKEFKKEFEKKSFEPAHSILLEKNPSLSKTQLSDSKLDIRAYSPSYIKAHSITNTDSLLYLSDTYYPGWSAYIDNVKTEIYKANYTFRAVKVPEGTHTIDFKYEPKSFQYGLWISIISIITATSYALKSLYVKKK